MNGWEITSDPLGDVEELCKLIREDSKETGAIIVCLSSDSYEHVLHEVAELYHMDVVGLDFAEIETRVLARAEVDRSGMMLSQTTANIVAVAAASLHNVVGITLVEAVREFNAVLNTPKPSNIKAKDLMMIGGMATGHTTDTSGMHHERRYVYDLHKCVAPRPDDDIISPMWGFIEIDPRKQSRQERNFKSMNRNKTPLRCYKTPPSRSGYRGVKMLKRLNRR